MDYLEMELKIADYFNYSINIVVPKLKYVLGLSEIDMAVITQSGYLSQVEIRLTEDDLKNCNLYAHTDKQNIIKHLYYAIPLSLVEYISYIHDKAGILIVSEDNVRCARKPRKNNSRRLTRNEIEAILKIASRRTFQLKKEFLFQNGKNEEILS